MKVKFSAESQNPNFLTHLLSKQRNCTSVIFLASNPERLLLNHFTGADWGFFYFSIYLFIFYQFGLGSGSKASFTPFVDPRVYQTSPTDDNDESSAAGKYTSQTITS